MTETPISVEDIAALAALANGIIPPDGRDGGAASVHAGPGIAERMRRSPYRQLYVEGLMAAQQLARTTFGKAVQDLNEAQMTDLLTALIARSPAFFRQVRADVCALYLSDAAVWQRIGFPGPSTDFGGYPDFDQPQH